MKLTLEKPLYRGDSLARHEGKAVFVPMALPGETVEATLRDDRGSFARAELVSVLDPSPERVVPPCQYYGTCGGCQYQHASYPLQLALKQEILLETLTRAGLADLPPIATHAAEPLGYRNRVRLHVRADGALGYRQRASHNLLVVQECPIAAPVLQNALALLQIATPQQRAGVWCEAVTLFTNDTGEALLLTLEARAGSRPTQKQLDALCHALRETLPALHGAAIVAPFARSTTRSRKAKHVEDEDEPKAGESIAQWGEQSLIYTVDSYKYRVSLGAFFQGNRFLVSTLLRLAIAGEPVATAWDLFAGAGLFTRALASGGARVTAVEGSPVSSQDLRHNVPEARAVVTSTQAFLASRKTRPDRILLDPPRAGLGVEASRDLAAVHSQSITYVSCDPATLARDLRVLVDAGYTITQLDLVDMFPQTFHMETVAKLRLR